MTIRTSTVARSSRCVARRARARGVDAGARNAPHRRDIRASNRMARSAPRRQRPAIHAKLDFTADALH